MREIYIEFVVFSNEVINHQELTEVMGISPTKAIVVNEIIRNDLKAIDSSWIYQTDKIDALFIDDIAQNVYDLINPRILKIIDYLKHNSLECKFNFVIRTPCEESFPSLYFTKEFIRMCSFLNASIDTDVYIS
jgi:hypothetical protein